MSIILAALWKAAALLAVVYLLFAAAMYVAQRKFLYFPDARHIPPASIGLTSVAEVVLATPDGEKLVAWWGGARTGKKTLLYFHGNAGHLTEREDRIKAYRGVGFGVLMLAYRGYSGSSGSPSEAANVADAKLAYDWLRAKGVAAKDIVIYGESLGTGIAVQVAAECEAGGVILDAPYTSIADLAAGAYPLLPVRLLLTDPYDSMARIGRLKAPLLVIVGEKDEIVPAAMSRRLFAAANAAVPKRLVAYPEGGHIYHAEFGSRQLVRDWVNGLK